MMLCWLYVQSDGQRQVPSRKDKRPATAHEQCCRLGRRANHRLSLEEVELPSNHPFATKQALSREQQEQALQNLRARSMRRRNFDLDQAQQQQQQQQQGRRGR